MDTMDVSRHLRPHTTGPQHATRGSERVLFGLVSWILTFASLPWRWERANVSCIQVIHQLRSCERRRSISILLFGHRLLLVFDHSHVNSVPHIVLNVLQ